MTREEIDKLYSSNFDDITFKDKRQPEVNVEAINKVNNAYVEQNGREIPSWEELKKQQGKLINPIISLTKCDTTHGIMVDQYTGDAYNSNHYYDKILDEFRSKGDMFTTHTGLEYNIINADSTTPGAAFTLLQQHIANLYNTLLSSLATDMRTCLASSAAYIEKIIEEYFGMMNLYCSPAYRAIEIPTIEDCINYTDGLPTILPQVTPELMYCYGVNLKTAVMTEYCKRVYTFIQDTVYDVCYSDTFRVNIETELGENNKPTIEASIHSRGTGQFKDWPVLKGATLDSIYNDLCWHVYNQLELTDASMAAILIGHVEKATACYSDIIDLYNDVVMEHDKKQ